MRSSTRVTQCAADSTTRAYLFRGKLRIVDPVFKVQFRLEIIQEILDEAQLFYLSIHFSASLRYLSKQPGGIKVNLFLYNSTNVNKPEMRRPRSRGNGEWGEQINEPNFQTLLDLSRRKMIWSHAEWS
jgi:hypothetical protein